MCRRRDQKPLANPRGEPSSVASTAGICVRVSNEKEYWPPDGEYALYECRLDGTGHLALRQKYYHVNLSGGAYWNDVDLASTTISSLAPGQWRTLNLDIVGTNTLTCRIVGTTATLSANPTPPTRSGSLTFQHGFVALRVGSGTASFDNIRVRDLKW